MKKFLSFLLVFCLAWPLVSAKVSFVALGIGTPQQLSESDAGAKESFLAKIPIKLDGSCNVFFNQTCTQKARQVKDAACLGWNNVKNVYGCIFGDETTGCGDVMKEAKNSKWIFGVVLGLTGIGAVTVLLNLLQLVVG